MKTVAYRLVVVGRRILCWRRVTRPSLQKLRVNSPRKTTSGPRLNAEEVLAVK